MKLCSFNFLLLSVLLIILFSSCDAGWFDFLFGGKKDIITDEKQPSQQTSSQEASSQQTSSQQQATSSTVKETIQSKDVQKNNSSNVKPPRVDNAPLIPQRHTYESFMVPRITQNVDKIGKITKLIFVGDTYFYKFPKVLNIWNELEKKYTALSLGAPGERTDNFLHRYHDGNILTNVTAPNPLVFVIFGTSNILEGDKPEAIANGITLVVSELQKYLNSPKIVVVSVLPRHPEDKDGLLGEKTNKLLEQKFHGDGGNKIKNVEYLDISDVVIAEDGSHKTKHVVNGIHFSPEGHAVFLEKLQIYLQKLEVNPEENAEGVTEERKRKLFFI